MSLRNENMHLTNNTLLQVGKYRIIRYISSGGFGCTYEAEHIMLKKRVAIKEFFVKDFCNRDEQTAQVTVGTLSKKGLVEKLKGKFIDEAQALNRLHHEGIVKVSDVFEENSTAYYVMDYVDGCSLGEIVKHNGAISEEQARNYIRQVCDALEYVHSHNRLHLDIKPGNIMISRSGQAVLIDFGASKQYDEVDGENTSTLMGKTPGYAPIEQIGNDVVKFLPATDIYSLGATMYKILTGITPPPSNIIAGGEEVTPLPPHISASTANAVSKAMKLNKKQRPQSVAQFRQLLDETESKSDDETVVNVIDAQLPVASGTCPDYSIDSGDVDPDAYYEYESEYDEEARKKKITIGIAAAVVLIGAVFAFYWMRNSDPNGPGTFVEDKEFVINGVPYLFTGILYVDSIPNGEGVGKYEEGEYKGTFVNGLREGQAEYTTADGENVFVGTYKDDKYDSGRLSFKNGAYYEGTFKDNTYDNGQWHDVDGTVSDIVNGEFK